MRRGVRLALLVLAAAVAMCSSANASGSVTARAPAVPKGFAGMNADGPLQYGAISLKPQFDAMVAAGVESVRQVFDWSAAQPYQDWKQVPPDRIGDFAPTNVPTSFATTDRVVSAAAKDGLTVLPVVIYAPAWDQLAPATGTLAVPATPAPYANYVRLLVGRYGPRGSFWKGHPRLPKLPIRMWQIWNEPNVSYYWPAQPYFSRYVGLLKAAHHAIKRVDPGAQVVLAGMPGYVWIQLQKIYQVPGARTTFDAVAVHPYTKVPQGVLTILQLVRNEMKRHGDARKPLIVSELTWPAALNQTPFQADYETTDTGLAHKMAAVIPMLVRARRRLRLESFYYFTWMSPYTPGGNPFNFSGLFSFDGGPILKKPVYAAFRRAVLRLERCARKGGRATVCTRR